jgi:hypothetical protein
MKYLLCVKLKLLLVLILSSAKMTFCQQATLSGEYFRCINADCRNSETLEFLKDHHFRILDRSSNKISFGNWLQSKDTIQLTIEKANLVKKYLVREVYGVKLLWSADQLDISKALDDLKTHIDKDEMFAISKDSSYVHLDKRNQKAILVRNIVQKRIIDFLHKGSRHDDVYVLYIVP